MHKSVMQLSKMNVIMPLKGKIALETNQQHNL